MESHARIIRRAARTLAQADMTDVTVTDSGKNDDGSWWLLVRDEGRTGGLPPYHRITLTIATDEEE